MSRSISTARSATVPGPASIARSNSFPPKET